MSTPADPKPEPSLLLSERAEGRRRLLRGGLGATPVLLTLAARPVAAARCAAASSFTSLDASRPRQSLLCAGRPPGYWKQPLVFQEWPAPYVPSARPVPGTGYHPPPGTVATPFDAVFGRTGGYPGRTLLDVLELPEAEYGRDALARLVVAALLNAARGLTPAEVLGVGTVRDVWQAYARRGWYEPTAGVRWYADDSTPPDSGSLSQWLKSTMSA